MTQTGCHARRIVEQSANGPSGQCEPWCAIDEAELDENDILRFDFKIEWACVWEAKAALDE